MKGKSINMTYNFFFQLFFAVTFKCHTVYVFHFSMVNISRSARANKKKLLWNSWTATIFGSIRLIEIIVGFQFTNLRTRTHVLNCLTIFLASREIATTPPENVWNISRNSIFVGAKVRHLNDKNAYGLIPFYFSFSFFFLVGWLTKMHITFKCHEWWWPTTRR